MGEGSYYMQNMSCCHCIVLPDLKETSAGKQDISSIFTSTESLWNKFLFSLVHTKTNAPDYLSKPLQLLVSFPPKIIITIKCKKSRSGISQVNFKSCQNKMASAKLMPWNPFTRSITWDLSSADASQVTDILLTDFKIENQFFF